MPRSDSQVSGERTLTLKMPASSIFLARSLVISSLAEMITSSVLGSRMSSATTRPAILSASAPGSSSIPNDVLVMPLRVPQSSSVTITSWAISTSFRVRYPELAVLIAVSANPFLAPCVEMKYSRTVRPSRKFANMGVSMISPDGFPIKPRIPAIWLMASFLLLAPESVIMCTELNPGIP